jgi:Raf kinase inhibitor-like YbhB/YbcL family protein
MAGQSGGVALALQRAAAGAKDPITVTSPAIHGTIARVQSEYGDGISPELWWDRVDGAQSYALILEDPDAKSATPFVHWLAYNIPAEQTSLPEGLEEQPQLSEPQGLRQGRTSTGSVGYFGPRPPVGDPPHHYHFQVFALDRQLDVPPGVERDELLQAMHGHVIAAGELVATYEQANEPI